MKNILSVILALGILSSPIFVVAADPVDLSDKKGVIDPRDLKKHDPKEKPLKIKEPPPPTPPPAVPPFEVDSGGIDDANRQIQSE